MEKSSHDHKSCSKSGSDSHSEAKKISPENLPKPKHGVGAKFNTKKIKQSSDIQDHRAENADDFSDLQGSNSKRFVSPTTLSELDDSCDLKGGPCSKKAAIYKAKKPRSAKLKTAYDIYKENLIIHGEYQGLSSIAARHTAIEQGAIQYDAGHVPREVGMSKLLVLITHFHTDHGSDLPNCIGYGERVTVFVPAYCAQDLFTKIRCDMSMQKGRPYTDDEIVKMVRIIGCKRDNGELKEQDNIMSSQIPSLMTIELVKMGDKILVPLRGREEVMVEPFACYHTVDTCGYVVYEVRKRLADFITLDVGTEIDNNFTEDQPVRQRRKDKKTEHIDDQNASLTEEKKDENAEYHWITDSKYKDVVEFQERTGTQIEVEIVDKVVSPTYTLKVRRLRFPQGMRVPTKNDASGCTVSGHDFAFFKKYKIDVHAVHLIAKTMFFGDTGSYVFNQKSVGYKRVTELLSSVETVIIESTFLEYRREMDDKKFKERAEKRHMFLFELGEQFKRYPKTQFLLIHFSACYDKETIKRYVDEYNRIYNNVSAFI